MKFRKKPIVIEAEKVSKLLTTAKDKWDELPKWLRDAYEDGGVIFENRSVSIGTLEGRMQANFDDWIIRGVRGELYPCKPDIFEATYEPVTGQ